MGRDFNNTHGQYRKNSAFANCCTNVNKTLTTPWLCAWAGVQSTQRAESIHHAVKKDTNASGLLTHLGEKLLKYSKGAELRSETGKARDLLVAAARSFSTQAGHMAVVQQLDGQISAHAMDIVKAQQAQSMAYTITQGIVLPNGVETYVVQRSAGARQVPEVTDERLQEDFGLPRSNAKPDRVRHVTLYGCTCQFTTC